MQYVFEKVGYLFDVDTLLKLKAAGLSSRDRVVTLSFDEMYVREDIAYDHSSDQFIGPHKRANVMLLRGLCKNYKIPIWYRMDTTLGPQEFRNIIRRIQNSGYHVISVSTDMHPGNQGLARKLGVTIENPRFPNPSESRKGEFIYWIYDAPHLLKLLRNWLLDDGFRLEGELAIRVIFTNSFPNIIYLKSARKNIISYFEGSTGKIQKEKQ